MVARDGPHVHAIVKDAALDGLDAALGELRSLYGWPVPEEPDGTRDEELAGRELIAERLRDEVEWLRDCCPLAGATGPRELPAGHEPAPGSRSSRSPEHRR
jgi:hypothetical protein